MMELKPCPFCGGEADMGEVIDGLYIVNCTKCFASSASSKSKELVVRHWNRRVTDGSSLIETCKNALEKQMPKKPERINKNAKFDGNWIKVCPSCGMKLVERITTNDVSYPRIYHRCKYCDCGQALDWGDE